ncbi:MAG: hypothetical protein IJR66_01940 [Clostridia bacterium]|nr:hypothetical protein [Clostridia bacterium]
MYFNFTTFLSAFSLPILLIAFLTLSISFLADKFLFYKLPDIVKTLFPFIVSILLYFIYDLISSSKLSVNIETVSSGVMCGFLSSILFTFINNLKSGKINFDPLALSIQGLIKYYANDSYSLSIKIANVIRVNYDAVSTEKLRNIVTIILKKSCNNITDEDIDKISDGILSFANELIK